jgi:hypothetical protein
MHRRMTQPPVLGLLLVQMNISSLLPVAMLAQEATPGASLVSTR